MRPLSHHLEERESFLCAVTGGFERTASGRGIPRPDSNCGARAQCPVGVYIVPGQMGLNRFPIDYPQCESLDGLSVRKSCEDPSGILAPVPAAPGLRTALESNSGGMEVRYVPAKRSGVRVYDTKGRRRATKKD